MKKIAVFASGAGSNAAKLIEHFNAHQNTLATISLIVCNKPGAGVIAIANHNQVPVMMIEKENFFRGDAYIPHLQAIGIDFIVLAGFLWKIPAALVKAYPQKIVNLHPALLPKYGGKGMYGNFVHQAVIAHQERESGITIHWVNELYDDGEHIAQFTCPVLPQDTAASLAQKIHALEHTHFAKVIEGVISSTNA